MNRCCAATRHHLHQSQWRRILGWRPTSTSGRNTPFKAGADNKRTTECPLCQHYGEGPCADSFWKWYECASKCREENQTSGSSACAPLYKAFSTCLVQHDIDEKEEPVGRDDPIGGLSEEYLAGLQAWQEFFETELADLTPREFLEPLIIHSEVPSVHTRNKVIVIEVPCTNLLAVMVHCHEGQFLYAAASIGELPVIGPSDDNGSAKTPPRCMLRIPEPPTGIRVSAVYQDNDEGVENEVVLRQMFRDSS